MLFSDKGLVELPGAWVHGPFWGFKIFARFQKIVYSGIYHWVSYIDNIRGYSSAFYHSMPSFAQRTSVCFRQVLRLCLVMPASMSPGPRTPLPKMCLPVWAVPHVAGTMQTSVYSAYSLPFHHKLWMKIFYLVLFKSFIIVFCQCMWPCYATFFGFISVWDSKCHISVNSQPIDLKFNLGAYIYHLCAGGVNFPK